MKPAWKELVIAINVAIIFLLILTASELAPRQKMEVPERSPRAILLNAVDETPV